MERWQCDFAWSDGERTLGAMEVSIWGLIAGLHTGHDDGTEGHGVNGFERVRHLFLYLAKELFEDGTS